MADPFSIDDNIIAQLGLESLPEEKRLELIEQMAALVEKRVILRLMEALDDAAAKEAEKLADDPEKLLAFLAGRGDIGEIVAQETEKVRAELLLGANEDAPIEE